MGDDISEKEVQESLEVAFDDKKIIETEDEERVPASYEFAEESVIGIFIQNADSASWIAQSGLREEHFQKRKNKLLYPIILDIRLNKGVSNVDIIASECEKRTLPNSDVTVFDAVGGYKELTKILQSPISTDLKTTQAYVEMVFERYKLSKVQEAARAIINFRKYSPDVIINKLHDMQSALDEESIHRKGLIAIEDLVGDAYNRFKDRKANPEKYLGIPTGFYFIDKHRAVAKKRTTIIGGKTSSGKSTFTENIIVPMVMNNFNVLWFTPELDKEEYTDRLICSQSGLPIDDWKKATYITEAQFRSFVKFKNEFLPKASNHLFVEDKGVQTASFILSSCKRHMLNHSIDVVVVDYLQKLKYYDEAKKALSDMVGNFYSFGKDNNIAMVLLSQLRRTKEDEPDISDLKECVIGSTKLIKPSGELVRMDRLLPKEIILALDENQKIKSAVVNKVWCTGKKSVFKLTTRTGKEVTATANHPFFTPDGWVRLENLSVGDFIGTPQVIPINDGDSSQADLCRLLGYMVGDGTYLKHCGIGFINRDKEVVADVTTIIKNKFGLEPTINPSKKDTFDMTFANKIKGYGKPHGNPLREWFRDIGIFGESCYNKRVPNFVFNKGIVGAKNFLSGYFATDGSISHTKRNRWNIKFSSVSLELCGDVQQLLLRLGIVSTIDSGYKSDKATTKVYNVIIASDCILDFANVVDVVGYKSELINQLRQEKWRPNENYGGLFVLPNQYGSYVAEMSFGLVDNTTRFQWKHGKRLISKKVARGIAEKFKDSKLSIIANSDVLWEPIKFIEFIGEEDVYDIEIPDCHNFIGNSIFLHNSGDLENFADVVILLHRKSITDSVGRTEGWYKIAKNRQGATTDKVQLKFNEWCLKFSEVNVPEDEKSFKSLIHD